MTLSAEERVKLEKDFGIYIDYMKRLMTRRLFPDGTRFTFTPSVFEARDLLLVFEVVGEKDQRYRFIARSRDGTESRFFTTDRRDFLSGTTEYQKNAVADALSSIP